MKVKQYREFTLNHRANRFGKKLYEKYGGDNIIATNAKGIEIGRLFYMQNTPQSDLGLSIGVVKRHQRKGIATAMVRMAQEITGRGIAGQEGNEEGRPFLESLRRPKPASSIAEKQTGLGRSKSPRITPKTPRLRR